MYALLLQLSAKWVVHGWSLLDEISEDGLRELWWTIESIISLNLRDSASSPVDKSKRIYNRSEDHNKEN